MSSALLLAACLAEIVVRAVLMRFAGLYIAYMLLTNWTTTFLLGVWAAGRPRRLDLSSGEAFVAAVLLVGFLGAWSAFSAQLHFEPTFPFMQLNVGNPLTSAFLVSALITAFYDGVTLAVVPIVRALPAGRVVRFIARNTLIVFLAHMPVYYALRPWLLSEGWSRPARGAILFMVCLPGLALVSEAIRNLTCPRELREKLLSRRSSSGAVGIA